MVEYFVKFLHKYKMSILKYLAVCAAISNLLGCVYFDTVDQPRTGTVTEPIEIELDVTVMNVNCQESVAEQCIAEVAIEIPQSWVVEACSVTIDGHAGTTNCLGDFELSPRLSSLVTRAGYNWKALHAKPGTSLVDGSNMAGTVALRIRPESVGEFELNYAGNGYGGFQGAMQWSGVGGSSGPHAIQILANDNVVPLTPQPVPVGGIGFGALLTVGMAAACLVNRRRHSKQ